MNGAYVTPCGLWPCGAYLQNTMETVAMVIDLSITQSNGADWLHLNYTQLEFKSICYIIILYYVTILTCMISNFMGNTDQMGWRMNRASVSHAGRIKPMPLKLILLVTS